MAKSVNTVKGSTDEGVVMKPSSSVSLSSSQSSSWMKTIIITILIAITSVIIANLIQEPGRLASLVDIPVQDVATSSSTAAVDLVSQLQKADPVPVRAPSTSTVAAEVNAVPKRQEPTPAAVATATVEQEEKPLDLVEWMTRGGAAFPHIEIVQYGDEYRGVHAKDDVDDDAVLADIPEQFIITFATMNQTDIGQRVVNALPEYNDLDMSHYFISIFLVVEYDKGTSSWWYPYLQTLPKYFKNMPPNFTPEEKKLAIDSRLDALLDDHFSRDYDELCAGVPEFCQNHTLERYIWARLVLRTRAFSLDKDGIDQTALQPFVDMINHDFDNLASWRYDQGKHVGQIYTQRRVKAGEVITISYGSKSNRVLLSTYGFAIKGNPNHEVPLFLQLPDGETASGMLARRVAKTGNPSTEFFRIQNTITLSTSDNDFKAAMKLCRIAVATLDELDQYAEFLNPVNLRNEAAALRYLQESIDGALYKYSTTVDEDEELLRNAVLSNNERNIIITRQSDKLTLMKMNDLIEDLMDIVPDTVDLAAFNKRRYRQKYADHTAYVRYLVELRRSTRQVE